MLLVRKASNRIEAKSNKELEELKEEWNIVSEPVVSYKSKEFFSPQGCLIHYIRRPEMETALEKLDFLRDSKFEDLIFERIRPDKNNNWINLADTDFESLLPVASKEAKQGKGGKALFELFSLGVVTNRDEWVYDFSKQDLEKKTKFFCKIYESEKIRWKKSNKKIAINDFVDRTIKWTEELEGHLKKGSELKFNTDKILESIYRPFVKQFFYYDRIITHRLYQNEHIFGLEEKYNNLCISFIGKDTEKPFSVLANDKLVGLNFLSPASGSQSFPLYRYNEKGERIDNITDWGLEQFTKHYKDKKIKKEDIFNYTYAVLHNPAYRKKYELNLKREFPRLPFYKDFWKWAKWGKQLMDLHINYEKAKPFNLKLTNLSGLATIPKIKVKLKADKETGIIDID